MSNTIFKFLPVHIWPAFTAERQKERHDFYREYVLVVAPWVSKLCLLCLAHILEIEKRGVIPPRQHDQVVQDARLLVERLGSVEFQKRVQRESRCLALQEGGSTTTITTTTAAVATPSQKQHVTTTELKHDYRKVHAKYSINKETYSTSSSK